MGPIPSYTSIRDRLRRLCHRLIAFSISWRGQAPEKVDPRVAEEGALDIPAPMQPPPGPQASAPAPRTMPQSMARLKEEVHGLHESLGEQCAVLDGISRDFSRDTPDGGPRAPAPQQPHTSMTSPMLDLSSLDTLGLVKSGIDMAYPTSMDMAY
ncbi:hypothetical protein Tco_0646616 [Tanacetum coccineum]